MSQYAIPAIRALIARDLIEVHNMTQKNAAKRLGMTQPAVSQYKKHSRGNRAKTIGKDTVINEKVSKISKSLAKNEMSPEEASIEMCEICKYIRDNKMVKKII